jgi:predicted TIM-barrel fold metal-dependent hydrolase
VSTYAGLIADSDLHFGPKSRSELLPYMPARWRDYFQGGAPLGAHTGNAGNWGAIAPHSAMMADSYSPQEGEFGPGTDYAYTREKLLDRHRFSKLILNGTAGEPLNRYAGPPVARAFNDWTRDTWLSQGDDRLTSVMHLPPGDAQEAAAEIRRLAGEPLFVAAQHTGAINGLPYGNPVYDPIYAAAVEAARPVHLHPNTSSYYRMATGPQHSAMAGVVMSLSGYAMHQVTSFIVNGTFEKFPDLMILIKEHGVLWMPHLMWRLDRNYEVLKAESPWVKRLPSEYIRSHIRIGSHPLEQGFRGDGSDVNQVLEATQGMEDLLLYCTDYPHMNYDDPAFIAKRLPEAWRDKVMLENSCRLHHWKVPAELVGASD